MKVETFKLVYFAYFIRLCHMELFSEETQWTLLHIQKKIIRIMLHTKRRVSCRELFKNLIFSH